MRVALIIAALCSLAGVAHATPASEPHRAYLTLIIDDLGQNLPGSPCAGPARPGDHGDHARHAPRRRIRPRSAQGRQDRDPHMPMDPATGPFAWHPELPIEELGKRLDAAFKAVPYTAGINNHMGSRMTASPKPWPG